MQLGILENFFFPEKGLVYYCELFFQIELEIFCKYFFQGGFGFLCRTSFPKRGWVIHWRNSLRKRGGSDPINLKRGVG